MSALLSILFANIFKKILRNKIFRTTSSYFYWLQTNAPELTKSLFQKQFRSGRKLAPMVSKRHNRMWISVSYDTFKNMFLVDF